MRLPVSIRFMWDSHLDQKRDRFAGNLIRLIARVSRRGRNYGLRSGAGAEAKW